jgi:hypothetical protein
MLGSQIIDINPRIAGCDLRVPEVRVFGYCKFRKAVRTNDDWGSHSGPEIVFLIEGEACWETDDEQLVQAVGGQAIVFPRGNRHRIVNAVYPPSESVWIIMKDPAETSGHRYSRPSAPRLRSSRRRRHRMPVGVPGAGPHLGRLLVDPAIFSSGGLIISEFRAKLHNVLLEFWKTCDRHALNGRASGVCRRRNPSSGESGQEISISELAER